MKRLPALIVGLFTLWLCSSADADCRTVKRVVNHAVYDPIIIAEFPVVVPAYTLTYAPVQDEVSKLQLELRLARQDAEILRLRVELQGMRGVPIPQKGQAVVEPEIMKERVGSATNTACASCHDVKGRPAGAPQFFTDGVLSATPAEKLEMIDAVLNERMPKGKKTDDETATKIMAEIVKSAKRKGV